MTSASAHCLRAVVEVVPVLAGAHPVVVGGCIVDLVVGVSRGVVELAGLGVLACGLLRLNLAGKGRSSSSSLVQFVS